MLNFSASMFFILIISSISFSGQNKRVKRSVPDSLNCLVPNKYISDCSSFNKWNSEKTYYNGNRAILDGYLFQLVANKSNSAPKTEDRLCNQIQDCIIWEIEWMLLGECQNIDVNSDMINKASSKTITDELDI